MIGDRDWLLAVYKKREQSVGHEQLKKRGREEEVKGKETKACPSSQEREAENWRDLVTRITFPYLWCACVRVYMIVDILSYYLVDDVMTTREDLAADIGYCYFYPEEEKRGGFATSF